VPLLNIVDNSDHRRGLDSHSFSHAFGIHDRLLWPTSPTPAPIGIRWEPSRPRFPRLSQPQAVLVGAEAPTAPAPSSGDW
jgi:hypothetical protein